mmetsp:Transcript_60944/g.163478  ORF Transcript_60944/g.163478 Transcript_60944/m.163478 type:complete len:1605 (+) Transcript_60944:68-4882(+)
MLSRKVENLRNSVFGLFYVMTERRHGESKGSKRKLLFTSILLLLDAGQVFKALVIPQFGWSLQSTSFSNKFDFVGAIIDAFPPLPYTSVVVCLISIILVVLAVLDTLLVMRLFQKGDTSRIWPVKILRFLVATMITTFYISILRFLLLPLNCTSALNTVNQALSGRADATCDPWSPQAAGLSAVGLALAAAFALFSLAATFFSFEVDPTGQHPGAQWTGRLEMTWSSARTLAVLLPFLQAAITPIVTILLIGLHVVVLLYLHLQMLPFHHHDFNCLRGGVYLSLLWLTFSSILVLARTYTSPSAEWALIALTPFFFAAGMLMVERKKRYIMRHLQQLRAEMDDPESRLDYDSGRGGFMLARSSAALGSTGPMVSFGQERAAGHARRGFSDGDSSDSGGRSEPQQENAGDADGGSVGWRSVIRSDRRSDYRVPRTVISQKSSNWHSFGNQALGGVDSLRSNSRDRGRFFGRPSSRAFHSASESIVAVRTLLHEKDSRDIPFLANLLERSLKDFPDCKELVILHVLFLRFVFGNPQAAAWHERLAKVGCNEFPLDLRYVLYAVERRAFQDNARMSVGKEGLSAINLMEFSSRTSLARRNHKMCIVLLKKLWKTALKFKEQASNASAKSLIEGLYSVISLIFETTSMYEELVHKFPGSTSLRHDYAHFLDSVLNDPPRAEHEHRAAAVMEAGSSRTEEEKFDPINTVAISTTSGTLSYRSIQRLYVLSWANRVMSEPERYLRVLHWTVLGLVTVLLLVAVSGFIVLEIYLVSTGMEQRLGFLEQAKGLRVDIFRSCYELRSIYLAACGLEANATSKAALNSAIGNLTQISDSFRKMHNYNYITFPHISSSDFFVRESLAELKVLPGSTEQTEVNTSFLTLGVEWSDSSIDATRIGPADLCNHDFRINAGMSDGKQAVVFIFSNLDVIFAGLRMFLDIIMSEIRYIQTLTNNVTYTLLCVETVMLLGISIVVLRRIRTTFPHCQVGLAGGHLTHGIDTATVQKFIRYYVRIQRRLEQLEYDHSDLFQMQAHDSQTESKDEDGEEEEEPCEDDGNLEPDEGGDAEMANVPREAARPLALPAHLHPLDYAPSSLHSPPGTDCFNTSLASQSPSPIRSSIRTRKPSVKSSLACGSEQFRAGFGPGFGLGNFSQVLEPAGQQGTSQVLPLTSANLSKHISRLQAPSRLTLAGASSGFAAEAANASGAGRTRICSPRKAQPSVHRHSRLSASPHMAPAEKASELHVPASRAGCDDENQPPLRDADPAQKRTPKDELAGPSLTMSDRSSGRPSAENGHGSKPSILRLRLPRMEGDAWDFEPPSCDRAFVSARTRASALNSGGGADRESVLEEGSSDARSSHSSQIIMDRRPQRTEFTPRAQSFERQGEDLLPSERRPVDRCSEPSPGARALETEANPRAQAENRATSVRPYNPESMDFLRINGCSRRTQDAEVSRHSRNNLQVPAPAILVGVKAGDEPPAGALYQPPPQPKRRSLHDSPPVTSSARGSHSGEGPISLPRVANGSAERPRPPPKPLNGEQRSSRALGGGSVKLDPSQALDKAIRDNMAWCFRPLRYQCILLIALGLCVCVWVVPSMLVPDLINAVTLLRQVPPAQ